MAELFVFSLFWRR